MSSGASFLLGNGHQLSLIGEAEEVPPALLAEREAAGRFTGERLFSTNPKLYRAIAALLGRGMTYREIGDICSVSVNTVAGVASREGVTVEQVREQVGALAMYGARLSVETLVDRLSDPEQRDKLSVKDLAIVHGILVQNGQLLQGGATQRMDTTPKAGGPTHDDYARLVAAARVAAMGLEAANRQQMEGALPVVGAESGAVIDLPSTPATPEPRPAGES